MTTLFRNRESGAEKRAKRGIRMAIAIAAASLCPLSALTGCTSYSAQLSEPLTTAAATAAAPAANESGTTWDKGTGTLSHAPTLSCNYYNEKEFMASIEAAGRGTGNGKEGAADNGKESGSRIAGGVTPHHLLAADMIAAFFRDLSAEPPDTIVVIGPNHKRIGFGGLHTSSSDWGTPFGRLEANRELVKRLSDEFNIASNDQLMQEEHSISSLIPYIGYYMPDVRVVPLLLHGNYPAADALRLGRYLGGLAKDSGDIAIIASVDFSHYLGAEEAENMDNITWDAIKRRDIQAISKMSNDNLDSPPSMITLLGAMDEAGAAGPEASGHSNSFKITGGGADYTTSYFTIFYKYADK